MPPRTGAESKAETITSTNSLACHPVASGIETAGRGGDPAKARPRPPPGPHPQVVSPVLAAGPDRLKIATAWAFLEADRARLRAEVQEWRGKQ